MNSMKAGGGVFVEIEVEGGGGGISPILEIVGCIGGARVHWKLIGSSIYDVVSSHNEHK